MEQDLAKKAAEMLLQGATLVSEPCPYCKGVRVIKKGNAFCVNCGKTPDPSISTNKETEHGKKSTSILGTLESKLDKLSKELENESDHKKQQEIIKSIDSLIETISKLKK